VTAQPQSLRSHFLVGTIRHRRTRITTYEFTHRVWYLALDLDEQDEVERSLRLLSLDRRNLLELRTADYLDDAASGLRAAIDARLAALGLEPDTLQVTLITYPRVLGYVFNPVSFYLCYGTAHTLRAVLAEVHNTHGEREVYHFLPDTTGGFVFQGQQQKRMYVSPFIAPDARYRLLVHEDGDDLDITIREDEADDLVLVAQLKLHRVPLTNRALLRLLAADPIVPVRTSALIFWHAIRLWLRGVPWRRYRA
jgi:DUF1365 family protein